MLKLLQKLLKDPDFSGFTPQGAPPRFRFFIHGFLAMLSYFWLTRKLGECGESIHCRPVKRARECNCRMRFASMYGRCRKPKFRSIIKFIEDNQIASRKELQSLIQAGDLRDDNSRLQLNRPTAWFYVAHAYIAANILVVSALAAPVLLSSAESSIKLLVCLTLTAFLGLCILAMYRSVYAPYRAAIRLAPTIDGFSRRKMFLRIRVVKSS